MVVKNSSGKANKMKQSIQLVNKAAAALMDLREHFDEAKIQVAKLSGQLDSLKKQLKKWKVTDIKAAEKKLDKMKADLTKDSKDLDRMVVELQAKIDAESEDFEEEEDDEDE